MKITQTLCILLSAALLGSCSVFNKSAKQHSEQSISSESIAATKPEKAKKKKKNKNKKKNEFETEGRKPSPDELTGAQWTITSLGKDNLPIEDEMPYVIFDEKGNFYGNNGCNVLNGSFVLRSDGHLIFSNVLSTMAFCPDKPYADTISGILSDGKQYGVDCKRIGQESYLYLKDDAGKAVATLRRHNMEFLNGNWQIVAIDGKSIKDEDATLFIDIPELKVHGNTGCNFFNGTLYIDPARSNAIDFSNMGLTRMACPKADQENRIMVALESTASAIAGKNDDTVLLIDKKGKDLLTLRRIENNND